MRRSLPLIVVAVAASLLGSARAQFAHNKFEFMNWWLEDREDLFPNYLSAQGNADGDGLFKVFPREQIERAGNVRISGYMYAMSVDDAFPGTFPQLVRVPGVQFFRTTLQNGYEVPDRAAALTPVYDPIQVFLPADGSWIIEVGFAPGSFDPKLRNTLDVPALLGGSPNGIAMLVRAPVGERRGGTPPGIVLQSSYQERHRAPGLASYSGSLDVRANRIAMFGEVGQPSATGELYAALRLHDPTLQMVGTASGGVLNDPQGFETHLGPGAYATDIATAPAPQRFGFFVHAEQYGTGATPTHYVFPLITALNGGTNATLPFGGVDLRVNFAELDALSLLLTAGFGGPLQRYTAASGAGFDENLNGVYASPRVSLGPSGLLFGVTVSVQGLITDTALQAVDVTNVVRFSLR